MKNKLYSISIGNISKVLYATNRKEALIKFTTYIKQKIEDVTNFSELQEMLVNVLDDKFEFKELKLPLVNIAYYRIGDRILWHNQPGYIDSYSKTFLGKRYDYQVNYNIKLDDGRSIINSRYDEIVNESTLDPNIKGISV